MRIRKSVICALFLLVPAAAFCQWSIGIKAGANFSSMRMIKYGEADWKLSFHGGVTFNRTISEKSMLSADLIFSQKGFFYSGTTVNLNYIDVPVVFSYRVHERIALGGGIYTGYLISSRADYGNTDDTSPVWRNKIDFGPCVQFGYWINPAMGITLRYEYGLFNVIARNADSSEYFRSLQPDDPILTETRLRDLGMKHTNMNVQLTFFKMLRKKSM